MKEDFSDLFIAKLVDAEKIHYLELEINQVKKNLYEVESCVVDHNKLGFSKALQPAKYFYKIPLDEGNFDVSNDFHNGKLIPVEYIPYEVPVPEEAYAIFVIFEL